MTNEDEYAAIYALTNLGNTSSPVSVMKDNNTQHHSIPEVCLDGGSNNEDDSADEPESTEDMGEFNTKFPLRLFDILDGQQYSDMIQWLPQGTGFFFVDKKRFEAEVLPLFFKKRTKFTSFTRRLIRWGFARVARGSFLGSYYHSLFQQGQRSLCVELCNRLRTKKALMKHSLKSQDESIHSNSVISTRKNSGEYSSSPVFQQSSPTTVVTDIPTIPGTTIVPTTNQDNNAFMYAYYAHKKRQEFKKMVMLRLLEQKRQQLMLQNQYMQMAKMYKTNNAFWLFWASRRMARR